MKYSVVIPVFNTTNTLTDISRRVKEVFKTLNEDYELIFVDDCSSEPETWAILSSLSSTDRNVTAIRLSRNFGQQPATLCGLDHATGDFMITMDDDLQHLPEDIPNLIAENTHDIVIGQYFQKKHGIWRNLVSRIKGYFDYLLIGKPKSIQLTSFRMLSRGVVDGIKKMHTAYPFIPAMMFYVSKDVVGPKVGHQSREDGKSGYSLIKLFRLFSNLMINNSSFLLRIIGILGFSIASLSFVLAVYYFIRSFFIDIKTVGWTSTIVIILFLGGMILLSIGVIGDYLIRIISNVESRPTYVIKETKKADD